MEPKFSIILPTYNRKHLISNAIESVLAQSVSNWELIIIDDGSTDDTKELVFSYGDARILYGYQENQGRSVTRNVGLHHARGEWICFLDSDDWYLEDHLETFELAMKDNADTLIFKTGVTFEKPDGSILSKSEFYELQTDQIPFILNNYSGILDLCIAATLAKSVGFPKINSWEDKAYLISLLYKSSWMQIKLRTVVALEHREKASLSLHNDVKDMNATLEIMKKYLANVLYRDRYLGPVQQDYLLAIMINANEMGLDYASIRKILKSVDVRILPMTLVRYWKVAILGR